MGKGSEGTEASSGESENNWLGSCKAHHVGIRPQEDRGGAAGTVGEGTGGEEEIVGWYLGEPAASIYRSVVEVLVISKRCLC
jgi:hypothetical protein